MIDGKAHLQKYESLKKRVPGLRETDGKTPKCVVYKIIDGVKTPLRTE